MIALVHAHMRAWCKKQFSLHKQQGRLYAASAEAAAHLWLVSPQQGCLNDGLRRSLGLWRLLSRTGLMFNNSVSTCRSADSALSVRLQVTALLKLVARGHLRRWLGRSVQGTLEEGLGVGALLLAGSCCRRCLRRRLRPRRLHCLGCQSWHRRGPWCFWRRRRGTEGLERLCWCGLHLRTPPFKITHNEEALALPLACGLALAQEPAWAQVRPAAERVYLRHRQFCRNKVHQHSLS